VDETGRYRRNDRREHAPEDRHRDIGGEHDRNGWRLAGEAAAFCFPNVIYDAENLCSAPKFRFVNGICKSGPSLAG
jgi:hypothetical protein